VWGEEEEFCWTNGGPDGGLVVSFMGLMTEPGSEPESKHMTQPQGPYSPEPNTIKTLFTGNGGEFPLSIYLGRKGRNQLCFR